MKNLGAAVSAFTGYLFCDFADMHKLIEDVMGRPVWTHEMGDPDFVKGMRDKMRAQGFVERIAKALKDAEGASDE